MLALLGQLPAGPRRLRQLRRLNFAALRPLTQSVLVMRQYSINKWFYDTNNSGFNRWDLPYPNAPIVVDVGLGGVWLLVLLLSSPMYAW
jgi:hypothetical protein